MTIMILPTTAMVLQQKGLVSGLHTWHDIDKTKCKRKNLKENVFTAVSRAFH